MIIATATSAVDDFNLLEYLAGFNKHNIFSHGSRKYYIGTLLEHTEWSTFTHYILFVTDKDPNAHLNLVARGFYGTKGFIKTEAGFMYEHSVLSVGTIKQVSIDDYRILTKFIK